MKYHTNQATQLSQKIVNYPVEFLNSLDLPGIPPYNSLIVLHRNSNAPKLCNSTRVVIKNRMVNVLEANILNGKFQGEIAMLLPKDPFRLAHFIRTKFAISYVHFIMTI